MKVTLSAYEILEGGGIKFNFVIENLQDKPADFRFYSHIGKQKHIRPYILDDQTNKYYNAKVFPPDDVTLMPNTPVEGYITFTQSKLEKAKVNTKLPGLWWQRGAYCARRKAGLSGM